MVATPNTFNTATQNVVQNNDAYSKNNPIAFYQKSRTKAKITSPVATETDDLQIQNNNNKKEVTGKEVNKTTADEDNNVGALVENTNDKTVDKTANITTSKPDSVTVVKTATEQPANKTTVDNSSKQKKNNKTVADKFAVSISAGADVSYVSLNNTGKLNPVYGAGLRYNINNHVTISSGLYVSKKVYTALPSQYKFSGYINPNLVKINADCNVYEIPLTVYYNFAPAKKHAWFAGAGLSSLLMKKEWYDYYYETPTGQTYNYEKTIHNENKHYFSILSLSAGYQYKLSNRISLTAEPYLKVPLSGIGWGK